MRDRNDVNDLFRRNQFKLRERPDSRVWNRLERRLDGNTERRIGQIVSRWSMAAAILVLIGVAFVLLQVVDTRNRAARASAHPQPTQIEDLPVTAQHPVLLERSVQLRREYELGTPILEGEGNGRLVLNQSHKPTSSRPVTQQRKS